MDTRSKSSRNIRIILAVAAIVAVTLGNFFFFPKIGVNAEEKYEEMRYQEGINQDNMNELVLGSYVLYYDMTEATVSYPYYIRSLISNLEGSFEEYRNSVDYYIEVAEGNKKNTSQELEALLDQEQADPVLIQELKEGYRYYFILKYDENGELTVEDVYSEDISGDEIIKAILNGARMYSFRELAEEYSDNVYEEVPENAGENNSPGAFPKNCRIVYAIGEDAYLAGGASWLDDYWGQRYAYVLCGSGVLFASSLAVLALAALFLTSRLIWQKTIDFNRRGPWYLAEAAVVGIIGVISMYDSFININRQYVSMFGFRDFYRVIQAGTVEQVVSVLEMMAVVALVYAGWYLCIIVLRPLFSLGPVKYVQQYSFIYLICAKIAGRCKKWWKKLKEEAAHVDFSDKTIKTIRKLVILNFIVLAVLSFFWFFGIVALAVYSVVLFYLIKKQYDKVEQDYQSLQQATARIAQGDLEYEDEKDWGVFEPLKKEFARIRSGFSKAVEEEVKSQRMKAELITNVSHDLKTPLTAITTYVELLKDPDITEEQRKNYLEILERKSLCLKVLVEDLFEVSKATSNTIKLDLMEVDVVNLLKQVCVEHEESFADMGLSVKWKLPGEKVMLMLDNQKTWRIFENLFLNIEKYAMPGSRVFIEVINDGHVQIIIKNMSAQELVVTGEEITERFVRGDASRTTEGSGLGLAIAKSFTEAQKGNFEVTVDGDLFKVTIGW